jgi:hypothetical protein
MRAVRWSSAVLALIASLAVAASPASAAPTAHWQIVAQAAPTYFHPGDALDIYELVAVNDGAAPSSGPFTLKDVLPPGLVVTSVSGATTVENPVQHAFSVEMPCVVSPGPAYTVECTAEEPVPIGDRVSAKINVEVPAGAGGTLVNQGSISGGSSGEASVSTSTPVVDPSVRVPYGASLNVEATGEEGLETQGGGRPFAISTIFSTNVRSVAPNEVCGPPGGANVPPSPGCPQLVSASRDVEVQLPAGLVGNATNVSRCSQAVFQAANNNFGCPESTVVGFAYLEFFGAATAPQQQPIYNIEPPPGQPAEFGFIVGGQASIPMLFHVRADGTYSLDVRLSDLTSFDAVRMGFLSIWGVPGAASHREKRCQVPEECQGGLAETPLLRMPTSCTSSPLSVPLFTDSEGEPGVFVGNEDPTALAPMSHCNLLKFAPTLEAHPTTAVADSPAGLHVDLHIPQNENLAELATPDLKGTVVKLPPNLTVNPSSANGLEGCTLAQFGVTSPVGATPIRTTEAPAACPDGAKIGTVEVDTPLLENPLPGAVYLATPYENPFDSLLAIYIAVNDPKSGVVVKLAGQVEIGAEGQLTTTFAESPQLPFEDFKLDFFGGARAALKTPAVCRGYETTSSLTPWSAPESGPPASPSDRYPINAEPGGGNCPTSAGQEPNSPAFEAGSESPLAGSFSPFVLHLKREDGSQQFSSLTVALPPGLLARLTGVPYCPESALAQAAGRTGAEEKAGPSCPAASEVGTVSVGAGAGPSPYYVQGRAYLAGPYRGAPLSLAIVTPALAGPFDLGTVVVRSALVVDPSTAQVTVKSDPIPTALKGIPLDVRSIAVRVDRSNFTLNPTNCEAMTVGGSVNTVQGGTAPLSNHFQVGGCETLPFKPSLALRVFGKTNRNAKPRFRAVLTTKAGEANIARAQVNLPHSEFLEQNHIKSVCTRVQFDAGGGHGEQCPKNSIYGHARAITPLLDNPVEGPVYLRSNGGERKLPDLVAALNGQIDVALSGKIDSGPNHGIRNTFEVVPDAPVTKFILEMQGGKKGLLVNSENLCSKKAKTNAIVRFLGQNGKVEHFKPKVANQCGKKAEKGR